MNAETTARPREMFVKAHSFRVNFNGVTASPALPQVYLKNFSGGPSFYTRYSIPSASSYDWATLPTSLASGTVADWDEFVSGGVLNG